MTIGKIALDERLKIVADKTKKLLEEIYEIEANAQTPANEKLSHIRKIKDQLEKVAVEVDNIKREFNLLTHYRVN